MASSSCRSGPELQLALIIEKRFARGAKLSSSRSAAIHCARLKKTPTGWNCSWNRGPAKLLAVFVVDTDEKELAMPLEK